ncbi:TPA: hypothetical protein ACMDOR_002598 [Vibrio parahaemolyticus]|uniref:hypothetical protein n=1 Tax=Vibrio parahaemolyticus TaxID=670 RepID=UPI001E6522DC|nr:hypothetical protein [Vibrio parahaemolyticus]MCR9332838.1 hypothetical protein [Vibrio parahaemolyticus]
MIEQKYKQDGMFQETKSSSLFPKIADLVLVFFPSPGVFIRDTLKVPSDFFAQTVASYEANGERFENMYVFYLLFFKVSMTQGMIATVLSMKKAF